MGPHLRSRNPFLSYAASMGATAGAKWLSDKLSGRSKMAKKTKRKKYYARKGKNYTRTRYKKKKSISGDDIHSGVGTSSKVVKVNPYVKGMIKKSGRMKHYYDNVLTLGLGAGKQATTVLAGICTCSQWLTTTGVGFNSEQAYTKWFDYNPNSFTTTSNLYAGTQATDALILKYAYVNVHMVNFESVASQVQILVCKAKNMNAQSPLIDWNDSLNVESLGAVGVAAIAPGAEPSSINAITQAFADNTYPYSMPRGQIFNKNWKVIHTKTIQLAGGATFDHKMLLDMNFLAKKEVIANESAKGVKYPRGSVAVIALVNGQVVKDNTVGGSGQPLFSSTEVGFVTQVHLGFKPYQGVNRQAAEVVTYHQYAATTGNQTSVNVVDNVISVQQV